MALTVGQRVRLRTAYIADIEDRVGKVGVVTGIIDENTVWVRFPALRPGELMSEVVLSTADLEPLCP